MRMHATSTAAGLALAFAASGAHAQTVVTQPVQTVRTVTTTRTVRPIARHRVVVTRRTYVTDRVVPATTATTTATLAPAAPLYDYVEPAPVPAATAPYYSAPLYDTVVQTPLTSVAAPAPAIAASAVSAPVGTAVPFYRYVYQPDRILVVDPTTGIAVQAIPR